MDRTQSENVNAKATRRGPPRAVLRNKSMNVESARTKA